MERKALGRGLSALIPEIQENKERIQFLSVDRIEASKFQPRTKFSDVRLQELSESIREKGVIQPILVRPAGAGYEIIAGERRLRAVRHLGLKEIPAIVKSVDDGDLLELSLIENIQREELNKIEEARAYDRLTREFGLTQELISKRVSKDRSTIANVLRLLELPAKIQRLLEESTITMGHAKSLLALTDEKRQDKLCGQIVKRGLSVRQVETIVRNEGTGRRVLRASRRKDPNVLSLEESLQRRLGTRVKILQGKKRGKIVIDFFSPEDLDRLIRTLIPS